MFSLESAISEDSFVRVVNAFVDVIDLESFGFAHVQCEEQGRPPYHPAVLLKLYLYGYRYGIRSSRKLEREARTNIEAMWLLSGLRPKYKTIADFRKDNSKAFREIFRRFVCLLKEWDLVDGETLAIDSFKLIPLFPSVKGRSWDSKIFTFLTDRIIAFTNEFYDKYSSSCLN